MNTPETPEIRKKRSRVFRAQNDIRRDIEEVQTLVKTGVLQTGWPHEVFWPVATRLIICVRDLVAKSEQLAKKRVAFTDDIYIRGRVKDAASLIKFMRDAVCHIEIDHHLLDERKNWLSMTYIRGKGTLVQSGDMRIGSDYQDEIAFVFGNQRVYLGRHLLRAFNEAVVNLQPYLEQNLKDIS
jgi:hypothetical protein